MNKLTRQYEAETGEKAMYRVDGAVDYHTMRYVKWLEAKVKNFTAHNRQSMPCMGCGSHHGVKTEKTTNTGSPKLLSIGNCEGCHNWKKGRRWGLRCTNCIRNVEWIVDNYAQ